MCDSGVTISASTSGEGNGRRRRGRRERGFPKYCRCGEEAVIRTSKTVRNPGRLFHCCPNGSEEDKYHLFTWTDERMVEEIEELKEMVGGVKGEIAELKKNELAELRAEMDGFNKEIEQMKLMCEPGKYRNGCCVVL